MLSIHYIMHCINTLLYNTLYNTLYQHNVLYCTNPLYNTLYWYNVLYQIHCDTLYQYNVLYQIHRMIVYQYNVLYQSTVWYSVSMYQSTVLIQWQSATGSPMDTLLNKIQWWEAHTIYLAGYVDFLCMISDQWTPLSEVIYPTQSSHGLFKLLQL